MRELLKVLTSTLEQERDCIYCAIVEARGSTPQKAGASMLVFADGTQHGTLGGGCVEAEVKQRALRTLGSKTFQPEVFTFSLDDNYGWDDGLICGGRLKILADPLADARRAVGLRYYSQLRELANAGSGCTEAVVIDDKPAGLALGSRYLFDSEQRLVAHIGAPANGNIAAHVKPIRQRPQPSILHGVAYLPVLPRITILLVGGGHVSQAVAQLGHTVDFDTWILDDRAAYANADRFPMARRTDVGEIGSTLKKLAQDEIDASTYCLIMTRGHAHDEEALFHLATSYAGFVGMLGSKRKIKMIYEDLVAMGVPAASLEKVHAPLGFAIGSQTVPEIAISIMAELIACRNLAKGAVRDTKAGACC